MRPTQEQMVMIDDLLKEMHDQILEVGFNVHTENIENVGRVRFSGTVMDARIKAKAIGMRKYRSRQWTLAEFKAFFTRFKAQTVTLLFIQE